jgi:DNA-binding protein HU-beta
MNKTELVKAIAAQADISIASATKALDALTDVVGDTLANNEDVTLVGFGTFKAKHRDERQGRNPQTGATLTIAAKNVVQFKPGKSLNDKINS